MSKIYLAGKITGDDNYREKFYRAAARLTDDGNAVMNPAAMPGEGFDYEAYFPICFAMIDACEVIALLPDWEESPGAIREKPYAEKTGREVMILDDTYKLCTCLACQLGRASNAQEAKAVLEKNKPEIVELIKSAIMPDPEGPVQ